MSETLTRPTGAKTDASAEIKSWAQDVLIKLGMATCGGKGERGKTGYAWHKADVPDAAEVAVRIRCDAGGRVTDLNIGGRPRAKHGSSQGQHTTAFALNREVLVAATVGRSESEARQSIAALFEGLLAYPAFTDRNQPPVPGEIGHLVAALADPGSKVSAAYSLNDLATLYLEIRDALPGASLDTGINGKAEKADRKNILGKAEGAALKPLRAMEVAALKGETFNAGEAIRCLAGLYDGTAEAALSADDAMAQRRTFMLTAAQAFPALFMQIGADLAGAVGLSGGAAKEAARLSARLLAGTQGASRPRPLTFAASVTDGRIEFAGRSDSLKESTGMGDHTSCEQLMKDAAGGILLSNGKLPDQQALLRHLTKIQQQFAPETYEIYNVEVEGDHLAYPFRARYDLLLERHKKLAALMDKVRASSAITADLVAEAAELYMALVDDRPTAVSFGPPAGNHGEQDTLKQLRAWDKTDDVAEKPDVVLATALKLVDCHAVLANSELFLEKGADGPKAEKVDRYVENVKLAAHEFMFFLEHAYPCVFEFLETEFGTGSSLAEKLCAMIMREGEEPAKGKKRNRDDEGESWSSESESED